MSTKINTNSYSIEYNRFKKPHKYQNRIDWTYINNEEMKSSSHCALVDKTITSMSA